METVTSYAKAVDILAKGGNPNERTIHYKLHTSLVRNPDASISIVLVDTPVVTHYPDGQIVLNSGGWQTVTTKRRINDCLPSGWYLYQEQGVWYVQRGGWQNGTSHVFADGITLHSDGSVSYQGASPLDPKAIKALRRKIRAYAKRFVDAIDIGQVEPPNNGDCWFCLMSTQDGRSLGDVTDNTDHILSHMDERYYVPSLLIRAIREYPVSTVATWWIQKRVYLDPAIGDDLGYIADIAKGQVSKSIQKYICHRLELA